MYDLVMEFRVQGMAEDIFVGPVQVFGSEDDLPLLPEEEAGEFFDLDAPSPFMLLVAPARPEKRELIPSALHVDGTSRLQTLTREENGLYYDVVAEFDKLTGVPMIINTSFNDHGEPIVCTPEDACACFLNTEMHALAMGTFLATKAGSPEAEAVGALVGERSS